MDPMPWPVATDDLDGWADLVARHPAWSLAAADPLRDAVRRAEHRARRPPRLDAAGRPVPAGRRPLAGPRPRAPDQRPPGLADRGPATALRCPPARRVCWSSVPFLYDTLWAQLAGAARGRAPARPHPVPGRVQRPGRLRAVRPELRPAVPTGGRRRRARPARRGRGDRLVAAAPVDRAAARRLPARGAHRPARAPVGRQPAVRADPDDPAASGRCGPTPSSSPGPTGPTRWSTGRPTACASASSATSWSPPGPWRWRRWRCPRWWPSTWPSSTRSRPPPCAPRWPRRPGAAAARRWCWARSAPTRPRRSGCAPTSTWSTRC